MLSFSINLIGEFNRNALCDHVRLQKLFQRDYVFGGRSIKWKSHGPFVRIFSMVSATVGAGFLTLARARPIFVMIQNLKRPKH